MVAEWHDGKERGRRKGDGGEWGVERCEDINAVASWRWKCGRLRRFTRLRDMTTREERGGDVGGDGHGKH